ncbi:MAG: tRNA pseudouridine(38-40) synthase TruA [Firmicutes bacterium]|nr:tRNA pseudouridine(38-40) synthase TruA [Bacillota bacterium]
MRNIKLVMEYDGTGFAGFQIQPSGRTVQGVLQEALEKLTGKPVKVVGAGRTDAGVHARGQVASFQTESGIPGERFAPALNGCLPEDLRILESGEAPPEFHARYSATRKTYEYLIYRKTEGAVMHRDHALVLTGELDLEAMREAAAHLVGTHSYRSFCASGSGVKGFIRTVEELTLEEPGEWLRFTVTADGFLYHMVRNIVGTLLLVGQGRLNPAEVKTIRDSEDRTKAGPTAPAPGLYLVRVEYE